ncbi:PAS domain-containing sensor histidine kinase [Roseibium sp. M-1]
MSALIDSAYAAIVDQDLGGQKSSLLLNAMQVALWEVDIASIFGFVKSLGQSQRDELLSQLHNRPVPVVNAMRGIRMVNLNDYALKFFGSDCDQVFQKGLESVWPEDASPEFVECLLNVAAQRNTQNTTCNFRHKDGTHFDAMVTVALDSVNETHALIAIRDVSALREGVAELEESEKVFRQLFQFMPVALTQVDASELVGKLTELRQAGIEDIGAYMDEHPNFLREAVDSILIEEVNQFSLDLLGERSAEDMCGPVGRYWSPSLPTMRRSIEGRYRGEVFFQEEAKLRRSDGEIIDVLFTTSRHPVHPSKSLSGSIDITQRKRSEEALRRSQKRYQDLFQAMTIAVLELDLSGTSLLLEGWLSSGITDLQRHLRNNPECVRDVLRTTQLIDVNEQSIILFGGDTTMMLARTLGDFLPEREHARCAAGLVSILQERASFTMNAKLKRIDGSEFDAQFTLRQMTDDHNRGLVAVTDISDRVQAYSELEKSEQRYRDLFHYTPIPVLQISEEILARRMLELKKQGVVNLGNYIDEHPEFLEFALESTVIVRANAAAVSLLGASSSEELKGPVTAFWRNSQEAFIRKLENRFHGMEVFEELVTITTLDGRILEGMLTVASPPTLAEVGLTLNSFVDLTEKRQAERNLVRFETDFAHAARVSVMGELVASIAHEITQPLAAIEINGQTGLRRLNSPAVDLEKVKGSISRVVADAHRAVDIVSRLRAMAQRRETKQELLSLDEVIREALIFLRHELQSNKITVEHRPSVGEAFVTADRTQLQQVVVNLALNAAQAMSLCAARARKILVYTMAEEKSVRCIVEDSGPGIPQQHIGKLFDSFFTTREGGMGLGLPVCRSIIEAHRGMIKVDSESTLGGARFIFALPAEHSISGD